MKRFLVFIFLVFNITAQSFGQEIDFGQYGNYNPPTSTLVDDYGLKFGQIIRSDSPTTYTTSIGEASIVSITGIKYLDVIVDIYLGPGSCTYPISDLNFDLEVAYDNSGGDQAKVGKAKFVTNISNNNSISFQIPVLERKQLPPGPPPTPPTDSFELSKVESTFYLFFFGSITIGDVPAGSYCNDIIIDVNYD